MSEFSEVLETFKDKELLIHMKDGGLETGKILWTYLEDMSQEWLSQITVYRNDEVLMYLREQNSSIRVLSMNLLKKVLIKYELLGWSRYIPKNYITCKFIYL